MRTEKNEISLEKGEVEVSGRRGIETSAGPGKAGARTF